MLGTKPATGNNADWQQNNFSAMHEIQFQDYNYMDIYLLFIYKLSNL